MRVRFDSELVKKLQKIKKKDSKLSKLIEEKLILFSQNPYHPSLRLHKLTGSLKNLYSISINYSIRMVFVLLYNQNEAYFIDIGTHDQVYGH